MLRSRRAAGEPQSGRPTSCWNWLWAGCCPPAALNAPCSEVVSGHPAPGGCREQRGVSGRDAAPPRDTVQHRL